MRSLFFVVSYGSHFLREREKKIWLRKKTKLEKKKRIVRCCGDGDICSFGNKKQKHSFE